MPKLVFPPFAFEEPSALGRIRRQARKNAAANYRALKASIRRGIEASDRGEGIPGDEAFRMVLERIGKK